MSQAQRKGEVGAPSLPVRVLLGLAVGALYYQAFKPEPWWPCAFLGASLAIGLLDRSRSFAEAAAPFAAAKAVALAYKIPYLHGLGALISGTVIFLYALTWLAIAAGFVLIRRAAGPVPALLALPGLWAFFEWAGQTIHFFPSQTHGLSAGTGIPLLWLAPYVGVHGITALSCAAAAAPWTAARISGERRRAASLGLAAAAAAVLAGPPLLGAALEGRAEPGAEPAPLKAAAFSLDAERGVGWDVPERHRTPAGRRGLETGIGRGLEAFGRSLDGSAPELIVLPEDAIDLTIPDLRSEDAFRTLGIENNGPLIEGYRGLARSRGTSLVAGLTTVREGRRYNSSLLVGPGGTLEGVRHKWWLTIGSEHWPVPRWLPLWLLFAGDPQYVDPADAFARPDDPFPPVTVNGRRLGILVCGEAHIPWMYLGWRRAGAEVLLLLANARWFRKDPTGYNTQLLRVARLCAAAYGLPIVLSGRAAWAGAIDARGRADVIRWPERGAAPKVREVVVTPASPTPTLAARWGEYYLGLSAFLAAAMAAAGALCRKFSF